MTERRTYVTLVEVPKCVVNVLADDITEMVNRRIKRFDFDVSESINLLSTIHNGVMEDLSTDVVTISLWISLHELKNLYKILFKYVYNRIEDGAYDEINDQMFNLKNISQSLKDLDEEVEEE